MGKKMGCFNVLTATLLDGDPLSNLTGEYIVSVNYCLIGALLFNCLPSIIFYCKQKNVKCNFYNSNMKYIL